MHPMYPAQYCQEHRIHVPCYVAHGTYIYQGLNVNVVCFSALKGAIRDELVTQDMMAPSKATSTKVFTPVEMATLVHVVTELLVNVTRPICLLHEKEEGDSEDVEGEAIDNLEKDALPEPHSTGLAFLVSKSPMKSIHNLPDLQTFALLLVRTAKTKEEKALKKGKGRLLKDGLPCLLTGDAFFQHVVEHEMEVKEKENEKEARKTARELQAAEWESDYAVAKLQGAWLKDWDQQNPEPKARDAELSPEPMAPKPKIQRRMASNDPQEEDSEEIIIDEGEILLEDNN
ncbi:hypothetical protein BT96DRAFT_950626 [Gymnopus androsaceus JB14]|uniref:Uncharacterized protein n=1 Tax=Gymnopus androsaceus JB14 TaxID=1447944 RepID=A0A6A4GFM0_9AGAR|nr:hypothetical protein BT96DRAFT_950626 [Gymnopus androsaceus JB14]